VFKFFASTEQKMNYETELKKLHAETKLFYKIQIFVNDLLTFGSSADAKLVWKRIQWLNFSSQMYILIKKKLNISLITISGLSVTKFLDVALSDKIKSHQSNPYNGQTILIKY
jgi:hypothetical protein